MSRARHWFAGGAKLLVVAVVLSLLVGQLLGQPLLLSYVTSDSMEPTLGPGDGFIALPLAATGPIEEGDVVVFEAERLEGGGLTTHRVVDTTDRGFITQGDANPFPDQDGVEPPVKRGQIVAEALQIGGNVLVIPSLGTAVEGSHSLITGLQRRLAALTGSRSLLGLQGVAYLLVGVTFVLYLLAAWRERGQEIRERDRSRDTGMDVRRVVAALTLLLVLSTTASMVVPAGTQEFGIVSAEFDSSSPHVIPAGTAADRPYPVVNGGFLPAVTFLEPASEGITVQPEQVTVGPRAKVNATLTLQAPPETGYYRRFIVEHRYLGVLPQPAIATMYRLHPWLPVMVIDLLIAVPFYLVTVRLIGTGKFRQHSRDGPSWLRRVVNRYR